MRVNFAATEPALSVPPLIRVDEAPRKDGSLIAAAKEGSRAAAEELVRRYWHECHRAAYLVLHDQALAEDVAQEAMLSTLRSLSNFDRGRDFRPWLHRITINEALDQLRVRDRRPELELEQARSRPTAGELGPQSLDVADALRALDPESRAIVVCRHLLGYQPREIARSLDMPGPTVRTKLRRALETLRQQLHDYSEE